MAATRATLRQLVESWPVVTARGSRDFGAYVQGALSKRLDRLANSSPSSTAQCATASFVEGEVAALEQLRNSDFKSRYAREVDTTFTGAQGEKYWAKLSAKSQEGYNTQSFFDRMFGRKIPSQHTKETAHRPEQ
eukprot:m.120542 g.120542  ORF g.120542 m.120542 type:complete len:134 (+) comp21850_c0_seq1:376-777(+)